MSLFHGWTARPISTKFCTDLHTRDGPRPDPTWAYFDPGTFRPKEIFMTWRAKLKNLTFLGEIFWIKTQTINGWPDPTRTTKNFPDPGSKIFTWTHHYSTPTQGRFLTTQPRAPGYPKLQNPDRSLEKKLCFTKNALNFSRAVPGLCNKKEFKLFKVGYVA